MPKEKSSDTLTGGAAPRSRLARRWMLALAAGAGVYALFGFLIAPRIARSYLTRTLHDLLHREVSVRRLRINPFVLSATADGFLIRDADGFSLLSWDRLYVNFQLLSLLKREWAFREFQLVNFSGRLVMRQDGTLNISDIVASLTAPSQPTPQPAEVPLIRIGRLRIQDARLDYQDLSRPTLFRTVLGPLRIDLRDFGNDPDSKNPYAFGGRTESGETFSWKGFFYLDPIRSEGQFTLGNVRLNKYHPYYQDSVLFDIKDGTADLSSSYQLEWGPKTRVARLSGANLKMAGVKISEHGLDELAVDVPTIELNGVDLDALTGETTITSLVTRDGSLVLRQYPDGIINLRRMIEPLLAGKPVPSRSSEGGSKASSASPSTAPPANKPGPKILISEVRFSDYKVLAEDLVPPRPVRLHFDQVNMDMHNVDNRPETTSTGTLSLRWEEGGTVSLTGDLSILKLQGNLDAKFEGIDVAPLDPYLASSADLLVSSGKLSASGKLRVSLLDPKHPTFSYLGNLVLDDFASVDGAKRGDFLKWKRLEIAPVDYSLDPPHLRIGDVLAQDPVARLAVAPDGTINLFAILRLEPASGTAAPPVAAPSSRATSTPDLSETSIRRVRLSGGKLLYEDRSLQPAVHLSLTRIHGTVSGLSSKELARADVNLESSIENLAPLKLSGKINPLIDNRYTDVSLQTSGVDLLPLGSYSGKYLGYDLKKGKLSLDMKYRVSQRSLQASNLITIDQLMLGDKTESPDATKLPVKLGVALLKDRHGVIELDVPVEGNLDDPEFRLGRVILHAIGVVFTKIVTSPFTLLARAFGGSEEDLSYLEYEPGSDALTPATEEKLNMLVTSLYERPALTVTIRGSVDGTSDRDELKKKKLEGLLRQEKWSSLGKKERAATPVATVSLTEAEYPDLVKSVFKTAWSDGMAALVPAAPPSTPTAEKAEKPATSEEMEAWLLSRIDVTADDLRQLAAGRAAQARDYMLGTGKVEAERLYLAEASTESDSPGCRAYLTLE
jgi:uncharacterized protein DUF748